jgi:pilus assembly protein CpaE
MVAQLFGPFVGAREPARDPLQGGRVIAVTGVRGGIGATTIAVNLAWHFANDVRRHTLLLDANLLTGDAALVLGAKADSGLRTALETPQRIDDLFIERTAQPLGDRLFVMASEEKLADTPNIAAGAVPLLLSTVRRRYNFTIVDAPFGTDPIRREFIDTAHQRIIVLDPTLSAVRDTLRMTALPGGPAQARRPVLVLARDGQPGGLTRKQVEDATGMQMDVVVPFLPKIVRVAATLGQPACANKGTFRTAILALAREVASTRVAEAESVDPKRPLRRLINRVRSRA